jgi:superfamily II DNA or RNA helicase
MNYRNCTRLISILFVGILSSKPLYSLGSCSDLSKQLIASLPIVQSEHQKQVDFIKNYLIPSVGARIGNPSKGRFRVCTVGLNCFEIKGEGPEKNLSVRWTDRVSEPEIQITESERILNLPLDFPLHKIRDNDGQSLINQWTMSTSLYPFSRAPENITIDLGLGDVPTHVPREIQENAIAVGIELLKIGRSFLYVAPTGTGKSYVLTSLLRNQIKVSEKKLHVVTVHQNELVGQMAKDFFPDSESGDIILLWPGAEDPKLRPNLNNIHSALETDKPVVIATSIQSITGRKNDTGVYEGMLDELTDSLATIVMDETHHIGATTWGAKIKFLRTASDAKFIGASATPIHKDAHVQKVFDERAFWAYTDHSVSDVIQKAARGESLIRPIKEVIDQAMAAIGNGELALVENFYSINAEGLKTSWDVVKRIAPLIERHRSGFIAVENRKEAAGYLANFETFFGGRKKFAVYHAGLPLQERAEIYNRMKNGEDLFLVVVNLLDEGVDFPHMSLYVDLNRKMNARNLLQRMGRVERPFSGSLNQRGKEYCEVATFTDWTDNETIAEHLALLTAFQKNAAKFRGRRERIEVIDPEGMIAINDDEMNHQFAALLSSIRHIMKEKTGNGPWEKAYALWVESGSGVFNPPKPNKSVGDSDLKYATYWALKNDESYFKKTMERFPNEFKEAVRNSFVDTPDPWKDAYESWVAGGSGVFKAPKKSKSGTSDDGNGGWYYSYLRARNSKKYFERAMDRFPNEFKEAVQASFQEKKSVWETAYDAWVKAGKGQFVPPKYSRGSSQSQVLLFAAYTKAKKNENYLDKALAKFPEDFREAVKASLIKAK